MTALLLPLSHSKNRHTDVALLACVSILWADKEQRWISKLEALVGKEVFEPWASPHWMLVAWLFFLILLFPRLWKS